MIKYVIEPLRNIQMFYIKYLTKYKLHMHDVAIRKLLYGCAYLQEIIHSLKLMDYLPVHTHSPYNSLHLLSLVPIFICAMDTRYTRHIFDK